MVGGEDAPEGVLGVLILCGERALHAGVLVVPEEVERRADGGDALLPALEDDEEVDVLREARRDFLDEVALRGEHVLPRQQDLPALLGVDQEHGAEGLETLQRELHG